MGPFADLEARIDALSSRASPRHDEPGLLREIEDLLAEGYVRALEAERLIRMGDQRYVREAAEGLRARLGVMHERWIALRANGAA